MNQPNQRQDMAVRAMTNDGSFRVIAIRTTDTARAAILKHEDLRSPSDRQLLAELLTGAVLVRQTMAPQHRVQVILRQGQTSPVQIVADAFPEGLTRGLVQKPEGGEEEPFSYGPDNLLQVMRVLFNNELQQGIVHAPAVGGISQALTDYMLQSEQVASAIDVASVMNDAGDVVSAGGFIVQMLPEANEETIAVMLEKLEQREALATTLSREGMSPRQIISELLGDLEHTFLGDEEVFYGCTCSELKLVSAMATLGSEEIERIIEDGEVMDVTCDYCSTHYKIGPEQLRPLLSVQ